MNNTENKTGEDKPRVSVTFPSDHYEKLQQIAKKNRVSVAWVVREAVEKYLDQDKPAKDR